jgi:hypothetical protein
VHVSHLFPIYAILALNLSVHTLIVFLSKWTLSGRVVDNYFEILCRPPYLSCPFVLCNLLEWLCSYVFKYLYSSGKKPSFYINWTLLSDLELSSLNFHWPWIWHKLFSSSSSLFGKYFAISVCSHHLVCFNSQWKLCMHATILTRVSFNLIPLQVNAWQSKFSLDRFLLLHFWIRGVNRQDHPFPWRQPSYDIIWFQNLSCLLQPLEKVLFWQCTASVC